MSRLNGHVAKALHGRQIKAKKNALKRLKRDFTSKTRNPSIRRAALLLGAAGFGAGLFLSIRNQPQLIQNLQWGSAFLVIAVGVPLTMIANAFEFILIGSSVKRQIPFLRALEISIIASAANMLPVPGGAMTRVAALKAYDVRYGDGIIITMLFAFIWIAVAFFFAGAFLFLRVPGIVAICFLSTGGITCAGCLLWVRRRGAPWSVVSWALIQRISLVSLDGLRLWWCLQALGINAGFSQAAAFVIGGVIGSAVSIVPAGMGIREGTSAALAPLVGLAAASGFMAAALNRILALAILTPAAGILGLMRRSQA